VSCAAKAWHAVIATRCSTHLGAALVVVVPVPLPDPVLRVDRDRARQVGGLRNWGGSWLALPLGPAGGSSSSRSSRSSRSSPSRFIV
jgi:hypothetical protein